MKVFHYNNLLIITCLLELCLTLNNDEQCSIRDTCTNSSLASPTIYNNESFTRTRNCFCDPVCEQYGDCCYYSKTIIDYYQCTDFLLPTINNYAIPFYRLSVWMRTKCLSIYIGSQVDIQCRNLNNQTFHINPLLFIPVTSLQTNITYRNYYCAYCNNDVNENIKFWEYKPLCHGDGSDRDYLTLSSDQEVQYYIHNLTKNCPKTILYPHDRGSSQPSVFIRPCKSAIPSICPAGTPAELAQKCSSSHTAYRYVQNSDIIYRNPYCAQCNHGYDSDQITCFDPNLRSSIPPWTQVRIRPLSILFDPNLLKRYLNDNIKPHAIYSINYNCKKLNEFYNLFEKKCTPVLNSSQEIIISMKCSHPMLTFIQSDDMIFHNNGSIFLVNHTISLTKEEYAFLSSDRIVFCADKWKTLKPPSLPLYRNILSVICTSVSLGCLLLFVIIFWLMPSLHNLPGQCLLFLSISLFIGQLTFIATANLTGYNTFCFLSAILIHYCYLSSFFWLLIISIHIHSTFCHPTIQQDKIDKDHHRIIAYNVLVYCSTGIFVLTGCLIQFITPESKYSPAYGLLFCSISNVNAMIVFFLSPIGCIFIIVTILFLRTLTIIYHSHKTAKLAVVTSSSNTKGNNLVLVYARLAALMGIQWIFLIFTLAIRQTWSWIIFEIINSLPGLFICFGFLFSKRTLNNLKKKISVNFIMRRQSSRSNTTTSPTLMTPALPRINPSRRLNF